MAIRLLAHAVVIFLPDCALTSLMKAPNCPALIFTVKDWSMALSVTHALTADRSGSVSGVEESTRVGVKVAVSAPACMGDAVGVWGVGVMLAVAVLVLVGVADAIVGAIVLVGTTLVVGLAVGITVGVGVVSDLSIASRLPARSGRFPVCESRFCVCTARW